MAIKHNKTRRAVWEKMRGLFYHYYINSWVDLLNAMGTNFKGSTLGSNTS